MFLRRLLVLGLCAAILLPATLLAGAASCHGGCRAACCERDRHGNDRAPGAGGGGSACPCRSCGAPVQAPGQDGPGLKPGIDPEYGTVERRPVLEFVLEVPFPPPER